MNPYINTSGQRSIIKLNKYFRLYQNIEGVLCPAMDDYRLMMIQINWEFLIFYVDN